MTLIIVIMIIMSQLTWPECSLDISRGTTLDPDSRAAVCCDLLPLLDSVAGAAIPCMYREVSIASDREKLSSLPDTFSMSAWSLVTTGGSSSADIRCEVTMTTLTHLVCAGGWPVACQQSPGSLARAAGCRGSPGAAYPASRSNLNIRCESKY